MKNKSRKVYPLQTKIAVGIEMIKGEKTISQICSEYEIHQTQAVAWKKKAVNAIQTGFEGNPELESKLKQSEQRVEELYKEVGRRTVEIDWLKKKMGVIS
jgi:transposase